MGLGEYTVKQHFSSSGDKSKGTELIEIVGKVKMDEVKKEMSKLNAERLCMACPMTRMRKMQTLRKFLRS